ncbi:MAG: lysophospholipid acyltransferase family protein [Nitratireductor sp.]
MSNQNAWKAAKMWAYLLLWLQNKICGTRFDFRGVENIPQNQSIIVAGKHQSAWETYTLLLFFENPAYIFKRSLLRLPVFGWYALKLNTIPVDRAKGSMALTTMTNTVQKVLKEETRQILIYPEGTRKVSGAKPQYKYGVTHLYLKSNVPVLPVALNSGIFWGRETFLRYKGTIIVDFLKPINTGLKKEAFSKKLQSIIEDRTLFLNQEAAKEATHTKNPPPLVAQFK